MEQYSNNWYMFMANTKYCQIYGYVTYLLTSRSLPLTDRHTFKVDNAACACRLVFRNQVNYLLFYVTSGSRNWRYKEYLYCLKRLTRHSVQENKVRSVKNTLAKGLVTENSDTSSMLALDGLQKCVSNILNYLDCINWGQTKRCPS